MENIKKWLEDPNADYDSGVTLLQSKCKNKVLINFLVRKNNVAKLRYELGKISGCNILSSTIVSNELTKPLGCKPNDLLRDALAGNITYHDIPSVIMDVYKETIEIYRAMRSFHEAMKVSHSDAERAKRRDELLTAEKNYRALWEVIDNWASTGVYPEIKDSKDNVISNEVPSSKEVNVASTSLSRTLLSLSNTKDEKKRQTKIETIRQNVKILLAASVEFKQERRDRLIELGVL